MQKPRSAARIPRETFASMVGQRIRASILDGTLEAGRQLNEMELAAMFGVSRGPVREALQRLIQEGLLQREPHRGVFVPVMSHDDLADIYFTRDALEAAAVRRVIESSKSASVYKALDRLVRTMEKAASSNDWDTVGKLDLEFHTVLVAGAGSPRLDRMFATVISETRLCMIMLTDVYGARDDLVDEHRQVAEFIKSHDVTEALSVLKRHFDDAISTLQGRLKAAEGRSLT